MAETEIKSINGKTLVDVTAREKKIDKNQGVENAGKILGIDVDGNVTPQNKPVQALAGAAAPTTATAGVVGQEYYVIADGAVIEMYVCTDVANGTYTWDPVEFGAEIDDTSIEPTKVWSAEKCNQLSEAIDEKQPKGDYALKSEIPSVPVTSVNSKTGAVQLTADDVGADPAGTADGKVSAHNTSDAAHNDIRLLVSALTERLNALANSTDEDLDQMAEIVAYIKSNKSLIDSITTSKVNVADIIDNLTTSVSNKPLSAKMGVELKKLIDAIKIPTTLPASDVYDWAKQPQKPTYTASEVGLGNVDDVRQYSASNPPPYPVTSVNGQTGAVTVTADGIGAATTDQVEELSSAISNLEGFVLGTANLKSWKEVQELVRAGLAPKILKVGDQLECQRDGVKLTWDIIGLDCDTPVNPGLTHSMTLQLHDGWKSLQFDAPEALYYCETELAAGTYNFTLLAGYDTTYGGGKTFSFTLSKPVPVGGVVMFPWGYQKQAAETKISTYASRESTTVLESVSVTEGANGTSLGTADGKSANMNHAHRIRYGSNKYSTSAMRQLLNSDAAAGKVWTPQTIFDRPPTWAATQNGFLAGLDPDFLAVVADVKKRTALNTITDGGGYEDTVEKFFLLSCSEVYAELENSVNEGNPYPYYSDFSDLSAAGSGEDGNRIKYIDGVAKYWWLRSPYASHANHVRHVSPSGTLSYSGASNAHACAPACTIA